MNNVEVHASNPSPESFTRKYTHASGAASLLIRRFFDHLEDLVRQAAPTRIIEVGCGPGYSTEILARAVPHAQLQACDIDPVLIDLARNKAPNAAFTQEDIHQLRYADESADLVVCLEVLEHVERPEQALAELARSTSAYAILSVPREPLWRMLNMARGAYWRALGNTPGHINHWSTRQFQQFVQRHFDIIETRTPLPWTMLLLKKKTS